ncbi:hypothetical protein QNY21_004781 [Escherichia coli]|nr:hypothetical protein [Escherichia coli]
MSQSLFSQPLNVINVGIAMFSDDLKKCGVVINSGRSSCSLVEPASLVWRGVW